MDTLRIAQSVYASTAHRYWNSQWSPARNLEVYGADASEEGVGSNFRIEIEAQGAPSLNETSLLEPLAKLKARLDHQSFIAESASTLERLAEALAIELFAMPLSQGVWRSITLAESESLSCTLYPRTEDFELNAKINNLTLTLRQTIDPATGLALPRNQIVEAVAAVAPALSQPLALGPWTTNLFQLLQRQLKCLHSVRIDLGRHEYLVVQSES